MAVQKRKLVTNQIIVNHKNFVKLSNMITEKVNELDVDDDISSLNNSVITMNALLYNILDNTDYKESLINEHNATLNLKLEDKYQKMSEQNRDKMFGYGFRAENLDNPRYKEVDRKAQGEKERNEKRKILFRTYKSEPYSYFEFDASTMDKKERTELNMARKRLADNPSKDIITDSARRLFNQLDNDESREDFYENAQLHSEKLFHRLEKELETIRNTMDISNRSYRGKTGFGNFLEKVSEKSKDEKTLFDMLTALRKLAKAQKEMKDDPNKKFDFSQDTDTQKLEMCIHEVSKDQKVDLPFAMAFAKAAILHEVKVVAQNNKTNIEKGLLLYKQHIINKCMEENVDPYKSGRLKRKTFFIKDGTPLSDGRPSYRTLTVDAKMAEETFAFNSKVMYSALTNKLIDESVEVVKGAEDEKAPKDRKYIDASKPMDEFNKKNLVLNNFEVCELQAEGNPRINHIDQNEIQRFSLAKKIEIDDYSKVPFALQFSGSASTYFPCGHGPEKLAQTSHVAKTVKENIEMNKKAYNKDEEKFNKENEFSKRVYMFFDFEENEQVRGN